MSAEMTALEGAITFYAPGLYAAFARLGEEAAKEIAQASDDASMRQPLWLADGRGNLPVVELPHLGPRSGVYCIAVLSAYLVWRQKQAGNPVPADLSPFIGAALLGYELWERKNREEEQEP